MTNAYKAMRWESWDGSAGVGFYTLDDRGCAHQELMKVAMSPAEMTELAIDLLNSAKAAGLFNESDCCCSIDWDHRCPVHGPDPDEDDEDA